MIESDKVKATSRCPKTVRRKLRAGAALLLALVAVAGCSGIEPYEPRNNREEGPKSGLLTGEQGEFVIFRVRSKPKGEEDPESEETQEEEGDTE
jgi:hypothetical protein